MPDNTVTSEQLAKMLKVSRRRVEQLAKLGMPTAGRGRYPLGACLLWAARHYQSSARRQGYSADGQEVGEGGSPIDRVARQLVNELDQAVERRKFADGTATIGLMQRLARAAGCKEASRDPIGAN